MLEDAGVGKWAKVTLTRCEKMNIETDLSFTHICCMIFATEKLVASSVLVRGLVLKR